MAVLFIDGFDKYGTAGDITNLIETEWTLASHNIYFGGTTTVANGLSSTGYAVALGNSSISKTLPGNFSRLIGGVRFQSSLLGTSPGITFFDNNAVQSGIQINAGSGTIAMTSGSAADVIAQTVVVSVKASSVHFLEWDVSFGLTANYFIYLDGVLILSGSGHTNVGTGNNQCNQFALTANQSSMTYDDLYLFDGTGSTNNAVLLTNPRIETQFPIGDDVRAFANVQQVIGAVVQIGNESLYNNTMILVQQTPVVNMTLNTIVYGAAASPIEHWTAVVYSDSGGAPNNLIAQSLDTPGQTGPLFSLDLVTPLTLTGGTSYWIGVLYETDTSINTTQFIPISTTDSMLSGRVVNRTYGLGPPSHASGMTIGRGTFMIYGLCTAAAANWAADSRNPPIGDLSFNSSSTVGAEDRFAFPVLTSHPTNIYTVAVKGYMRLTDTGNRSADLTMKSGAVESNGSLSTQIPSTSYEWVESFFDNDPNTSSAWTEAALNAAVSGVKVAT